MSSPRVTVLTTLYNKGPFVERAVDVLLDRSFGDLELFVSATVDPIAVL